jgi:hypothetical protein
VCLSVACEESSFSKQRGTLNLSTLQKNVRHAHLGRGCDWIFDLETKGDSDPNSPNHANVQNRNDTYSHAFDKTVRKSLILLLFFVVFSNGLGEEQTTKES